MSDIIGTLLNLRKYSFLDDAGKLIEGADISIAAPAEQASENFLGSRVAQIKFPIDKYPMFTQQAANLIGKSVVVTSNLVARGKNFVPVPTSIKASS